MLCHKLTIDIDSGHVVNSLEVNPQCLPLPVRWETEPLPISSVVACYVGLSEDW
jgi:hypothetical protein